MAKLNDLSESTAISNDDILHLRTTGGIDKKITGTNLRQTLVNTVLTVNTTQAISLSSYTTGLTIVGTQTSPITLTLTNVLNNGKILKILNPTAFLMTVTLGGVTYEVSENGELNFTSNTSAMILARLNLTTITGNTSFTLNKGIKGKVFICEPTADMTLTITDGGADEREYITVVNNSVYRVTVQDATYSYWLNYAGQKVDFNIDYAGDLRRSIGWGLQYKDYSNTAAVSAATLLDGTIIDGKKYRVILDSATTIINTYTSEGVVKSGGITSKGMTSIDGALGAMRFVYTVGTNNFTSEYSTFYIKEIWRFYD